MQEWVQKIATATSTDAGKKERYRISTLYGQHDRGRVLCRLTLDNIDHGRLRLFIAH
jgi:hypothetical protein